MRVSLILADGTCFKGESFDRQPWRRFCSYLMTGYPELLTEPASRGQLLVMTYPVIGNLAYSIWMPMKTVFHNAK